MSPMTAADLETNAQPGLPLGSSGYRLFPFGVCRIADRPFTDLAALRSSATLKALSRLAELESAVQSAQARLALELHRAVGEATPTVRRDLLAAARYLRRKGKLSPTHEKKIHRLKTDVQLVQTLSDWLDAQDQLADRAQQADGTHETELVKHAEILNRLTEHPRFLNALALASPIVFDRRNKHNRDKRTRDRPAPHERDSTRLDRSLLKYYSRAATKTTPFGSFTSIASVSWQPEGAGHSADPLIRLPEHGPSSALELNKVLYAALIRLLRQEPDLFPELEVTLNPSLRQTAEGFTLLSPRGGLEKIVQLPALPAVVWTFDRIRDHGGTCPYEDLVRELAEAFGAAADQIRPRINQMLDAGFLQLNTSIADHELSWAPKLLERLRASRSDLAQRLRRSLRALEKERLEFADLQAEDRLTLLKRARKHLDSIFDTDARNPLCPTAEEHRVGEEHSVAEEHRVGEEHLVDEEQGDQLTTEAGILGEQKQLLARNLFYEDSYLTAPVQADFHRLKPAFNSLAHWVAWMSRCSLHWCHQANMRAHFEREFGGRESVPFLDFFPSFYAQVYQKTLHQERDPSIATYAEAVDPFGLPTLPRAIRSAIELRTILARRWQQNPRADAVHFDRTDLEGIDTLPITNDFDSVSLFLQLIPRGSAFGEDALLVDQQSTQVGMGRYMSRFLNHLDPLISERLRALSRRFPGAVVAELCDDGEFSFNANLHPELTDWQINYPARLTGLDPNTNLALADLEVRPDPDQPIRMQLLHPGLDKVVLPVDLGFVNSLRRPPLFRVLALFTPFVSHRICLPWEFDGSPITPEQDGSATPGEQEVIYRPRMIFERRVVLSRGSWSVPAELLRRRVRGKSPVEAFGALHRWHREAGLPEEVFFFVPRVNGPTTDDSARPTGRRVRRPTHKPQFLSFASAMLCRLLLEVIKDYSGRIQFEEVLPSPDTLPTRRGQGHATEFIAQLDREFE